jgi:predicted Zn-dependent protease with MMP-like domain
MRMGASSGSLEEMEQLTKRAAYALHRLPDDLQHEFPDVPFELLEQRVDVHTNELLETAKFDDFIPLLVGRRIRERLHAGVGAD